MDSKDKKSFMPQNQVKTETLELTLRGRVFLAALRSGIIDRVQDLEDYKVSLFLDEISKLQSENHSDKLDDSKHVLSNGTKRKTQGARNNRRFYRDLVLTSVSSFSVFFILAALLESGGFGSFFAAALLCLFTAILTCKIKDALS